VAPRMATLGGRVGHGRGAPGVGGRRILRGQEEGAGHWPRSSAHQARPMVSPDLAKGLPHRSPLGGWGWEVAPCTRGVPRTAQLAAAPGVHGVPLSPSVPPPSVPPASSPKCRVPPPRRSGHSFSGSCAGTEPVSLGPQATLLDTVTSQGFEGMWGLKGSSLWEQGQTTGTTVPRGAGPDEVHESPIPVRMGQVGVGGATPYPFLSQEGQNSPWGVLWWDPHSPGGPGLLLRGIGRSLGEARMAKFREIPAACW
jgi:hypothetical protein